MIEKVIGGKKHWFNDNNKKLLSFSSAIKPFNNKYLFVNSKTLDETADFGKEVMRYIEDTNNMNFDSVNSFSDEVVKASNTIISKLEKESKELIAVEKHINNDTWHGFIDIDCDKCFIELKTRSNFHLELETIIQCEVYKRICNKEYEIWYYNKKTNEVKSLKPTPEQILKAKAIIKSLELVNNLLNN